MRRFIVLLCCVASVWGVHVYGEAAKTQTDLSGALVYFKPSDDESYDSAFGVEGQMRFWQNEDVGFALAVGLSSWELNELGAYEEYYYGDYVVAVEAVAIDGKVLTLPIGGSVLFRPMMKENISVTIEAGIRYVLVESDAEVEYYYEDITGYTEYIKEEIEIDNGIVGLIAVDVEGKISKDMVVFAGVGYQFDIDKGDAELSALDISAENELEALVVRGGLRF